MSNKEKHSKTWFVDIDGTILKDLSNKEIDDIISKYGFDSYLQEQPLLDAIDFFRNLPKRDRIILTTAREIYHKDHTLKALDHYKMPYDDYIFELGSGPRVVVNDIKPAHTSGNEKDLDTAYAINVIRDGGIDISYQYRNIESNYNHQMSGEPQLKQLIQE